MKFPKQTKRYCPHCKKHTTQTIATAKQKTRSAAHPHSRFGSFRIKSRGVKTGYGNLGRFSKPAVKSWKRKIKVTKRITMVYKCNTCGKMKGIKKAIRSGRIEVGDKVSK